MEGLNQLTRWHHRGVEMAAGSQGLWPQNVEEVTNDVFVKFWNIRERLDCKERGFLPYLKMMAKNLARDRVRRERSVVVLHNSSELPESIFDQDIDSNFIESERRQKIEVCLNILAQKSPQKAQVIRLRFLEEKSPKEVAEILGMTPTHVNVTLHRALKELSKIWHSQEAS